MHRRKSLIVIAVVGLILSAGVVAGEVPAHAATSGNDFSYVSPGSQYANWSRTNKQLRLVTSPGASMNTDRCMDAMLDWQTSSGHYDARVVRSCRPGTSASTDYNGDGYWQEPSDWAGRTIVDMQKGLGASIDDDYVSGNFALYASENFAGAGGGAYTDRPRTCTDKWARTSTYYEAGYYNSCNENSNPSSATS